MGLIERLSGAEDPKISPHLLFSVLQQNVSGIGSVMSDARAVTALGGLNAAEQQTLVDVRAQLVAGTITMDDLHSVIMLVESGEYSAADAKTALNIV